MGKISALERDSCEWGIREREESEVPGEVHSSFLLNQQWNGEETLVVSPLPLSQVTETRLGKAWGGNPMEESNEPQGFLLKIKVTVAIRQKDMQAKG